MLPPNVALFTECGAQGNEFELIPTIKMETRRPAEIYFGREYAAICSYCGVMTVSSRKTWKYCEQFLRLFGKTIPLKLSLLCGSRTKSARAIPPHLAHIIPDFIQIGSPSAELLPNA